MDEPQIRIDAATEFDDGTAALIAPGVLMVYGLIMPVLMIVFYVQPFQEARGELLPDGSIDWLTGEAMLAVSWFFIYIALGWFAVRVIRNNYSPPRYSIDNENANRIRGKSYEDLK